MKNLLFATVLLLGTGFTGTAVMAQEDGPKAKDKKKETQEITIRSSSAKDKKITVEINGDNVTVNGKPLSEFKDADININKRNISVWDGNMRRNYELATENVFGDNKFWNDSNAENRAFLGVTTEEVEGGAKIAEITKESAAEKAGLKTGDIITKIGDKKITGPETLLDAVTAMKPKDEVNVSYKRDGKDNQAKVILGERKGSGAMFYSFSGPDGISRSYTVPRVPRVNNYPRIEAWGDKDLNDLETITIAPRTFSSGDYNNKYQFYNDAFARQQKLGLKIQDTEEGNGVKVLDVEKESPAEKAGLKKDDVVTEIGGKKLTNTDEARELLHDNQDKSTYNIKARRNGSEMSFDIKIPKKLKTANL